MAGQVTIYDVAAEAGVSISTVSLALNSPHRVSSATRQKVLTAADTLGFVPKADAVTRARKGLGRIGVIAPFTSYPSFSRRLNGILLALQDEPLEAVVFDQQSAARAASPLLASLPITRRLDGLIVMALPLDEGVAERLRREGLPTVLVDTNRPDFDTVSTDDLAGGALVADHLADRGHTRFGFLGERQRSHAYVSPSEQRLAGFRTAVERRGATLPDSAVRHAGHDIEAASAAARELLASAERPTAVFAHDDVLAAGVVRAARDLGLRMPEDLAVVGFDDSELAAALGLSTVRQQFEESGRLAVRSLLDRMRHASAARRHTVLALELVHRDTS